MSLDDGMEDEFREAVTSAAFWALVDDDASEEERTALADELKLAWPPDVPTVPLGAQSERMDRDLREALRAQGLPDDQVFVAAYALAHQIKFGEAFKPD